MTFPNYVLAFGLVQKLEHFLKVKKLLIKQLKSSTVSLPVNINIGLFKIFQTEFKNPYKFLGIEQNASYQNIKRQYW